MLSLTEDIARISMLHPDALGALSEYAARSRAGILEVGPYIGGSSVALALGNAGRRPHAAIEIGGAQDHPTLPSRDIIADWRANTERFSAHDVLLCQGWSYQRNVRKRALDHVGEIGLLFLDADGNIAPTMRQFAPFMRADCLLALDDYVAPGARSKQELVAPWIDGEVRAGRIVQDRVVGGTWFGHVINRSTLTAWRNGPAFIHDEGFAWKAYFDCAAESDVEGASPLRLFQGGRELGPAHSAHATIRASGHGRFSHWRMGEIACLYFSERDNGDPNKRGYEVDWGEGRRDLRSLL